MRIRRVLRFWPALVVLGVLLVVYALWPARFNYTVGPQTTYVTEPVDGFGVVDYVAALNDRMATDVTPEANANVLIVRALGPHPEGGTMPPEYYRRLGIPSPPEQGEYLVTWDKYFGAHLKTPPDDVLGLIGGNASDWQKQWSDRFDRTTKWPWRRADHPEIADWLKVNEKPLALMVEAGKRPAYYNPLVSKSADPTAARLIGSLLPTVQMCRAAGLALACRAMARAGEGDYEGAWQDLLACQRLGRTLARGGTIIEDLVGIALVAIATNAEITVVGHGTHSSKRLLGWLADLRALPPMPPLADKLALGERFMMLDSLLSVACHGPEALQGLSGPGTVKPSKNPLIDRMLSRSIDFDPAFRNANRMYDQCEAACRLPDRARRKQAFAEVEAEVSRRKGMVTGLGAVDRLTMGPTRRGEFIGNIMIGLMVPALGKILDANDRTEQTQANLRVAIALAAYRGDAGRYPVRLDDLAPRYLPTIPGDLFSGQPLVYRPAEAGYLLYSVGVNEIDEGGRWTDDDPKGDDLRVRMPVRPPGEK